MRLFQFIESLLPGELPTQIALGAVVIGSLSVIATQKLDSHVKETNAQKNTQQLAESLAAKAKSQSCKIRMDSLADKVFANSRADSKR